MKLHHIALSVLFVSMITLGMMTFIEQFGAKHSETADFSDLENTNESLKKLNKDIKQAYGNITDISLKNVGEAFEIPYELIVSGMGATRVLFDSFDLLGSMIGDTVNVFTKNVGGLPEWLIPTITVMIMLTVVAILIYAFFKWKFED